MKEIKSPVNVMMTPTTKAKLQALAERTGKSVPDTIARLILEADKPGDEITDILLPVYEAVFHAMQRLEYIKIYGDGLSREAKLLDDLLDLTFRKLRSHPNFWEPKKEE